MRIDKTLTTKISSGDEKTIYQLYRYCHDQLYMVCRRYVTNEDEVGTLLNTAFLKIIKYLGSYDSKVPFEAWIKRIMINTAIDYYRKNKKYRETIYFPEEDHVIYNSDLSVDYNTADQYFDAVQLLEMVNQLAPVTKTVFNLFAIDGYSHKEIAEMLHMSEGTSKWHLSSARKKLQELLVREMKNDLIGNTSK